MRLLAALPALAVSIALSFVFAAAMATSPPPRATQVRVDKSERRLYVHVGDKIVASYPVALGIHPVGHKLREGDRKTPEGRYALDYKKADSAFHRAIHISYPNAADRETARKRGEPPGGAIMIHGQPNDPELRRRVAAYPDPDWTDGCIALSNVDMDALWAMVTVPVPIVITP